jgi:uncharacterized protein (TIGR03083 family)
MHHEQHCDQLEVEIERFACALDNADDDVRVPSCPEWNVHELAEHLGTIHRWAEHLVRAVAPARIPTSQMGLELGPVNPAWLRSGGATLVSTLRQSDPDAPMWAWGADQHVRFWSRRQLHETMMHRIDLELATGASPFVEAEVASDGIDEFLVNLKGASYFSPQVKEIRGPHQVLRFETNDAEGEWTVEITKEGFLLSDEAPADAELFGAAADLLMVLYRRRDLEASDVIVRGDRGLVDFWLTHSALE